MYITLQLRTRKTSDGSYEPGFLYTEFRENQLPVERPYWCHHTAQPTKGDALNAARALAYAQVRHQYPRFVTVKEIAAESQVLKTAEDRSAQDPDICPEQVPRGILRNALAHQHRMVMRRRKRIERRRRAMKRTLANERPGGY